MYRDDSDIGKLMHDFSCPDPADMYYQVLAERASFLKEKEEGVTEMCKIMDEMMREAAKDAVQEKCYELAIEMIKDNDMTDDKIIKYTGMTLEEIQELREELSKEFQA